jgi:Ca-activated chloride channel family protein
VRTSTKRLASALVAALALTACSFGGSGEEASGGAGEDGGVGVADPGDCLAIDVAVSSEKIDLLTDLAETFNASDEARTGDRCTFVRPYTKASGEAARLLAEGWTDEEADGPRPVIWSPASSAWGAVVNQRLADQGQPEIAPPSEPFMLTPLVIAVPQPMAEALGYPEQPVGWADVLQLARDDQGWGAFGNPQWGPFRLGKTNPNFSTSGLSALIAQYYAATGKTADLSAEDLARPEVQDFARGVESAVVHYGDTTLTFLNNLARADARGTALTYASAVAVEEVSVVNYNRGNPDGVLQPGEEPVPPRVPLVAIYPEEGTLFSDNPFITLDAEWVDDAERTAAAAFTEYVTRPENQERVLEFGFRPGNPEVPLGAPITPENGLDPAQPQTELEVPDPAVLVELLDLWDTQRKGARVLMVIDVSGSMGDPAGSGGRETKLELAQRAAVAALEQFSDADEVGLRVFSTDLSPTPPTEYVDLVPIGPITEQRDELRRQIENLVPTQGTPLYTVTRDSYRDMVEGFAPDRINAVVLLSDGRNEDPANTDLDGLLAALTEGTEGGSATPVRVFPIAYGQDSDLGTLRRVAEATNAAVYDASDARSIDRVLTAVISNF